MVDEHLFQIAYNDFADKEVDQAIWIKAMALSGGDKQRAKWHYVALRVEQMLRDPALEKSLKPSVIPSSSSSGAYMIWISVLLFFAMIGVAISFDFNLFIFQDENLLQFADIPSLLMIVLPAIIFSIAATSWKSYWHSWTYPFLWRKQVAKEEAQSAARCIKVKGDAGFVMGIIGTIIGALMILQNLDSIKEFGEVISICSLTLFYGFIYKLLCYIAEQRVRNLYLNS